MFDLLCDPRGARDNGDPEPQVRVPDVLLEVLAMTKQAWSSGGEVRVPGRRGPHRGVVQPKPLRLRAPDRRVLPCAGYPGVLRVPACGDVTCRNLPCYTWHLGVHLSHALYSQLQLQQASTPPEQGAVEEAAVIQDLLETPITLDCCSSAEPAAALEPVQATVTTPGGTVTLYRWPSPGATTVPGDDDAEVIIVDPPEPPKKAVRGKRRAVKQMGIGPPERKRPRPRKPTTASATAVQQTDEEVREALEHAAACMERGEHDMISHRLRRALLGVARALHS
ncbi:Voltage-dependent P/Q-type calcium channel subunit alpha-1A [Frankliniella fusca]|uniref:Voltage-dependent P/Q-type calcium channel subunit alpha-1A n=1 Tax=Frankliniella fusca TaxID=407009 RepID=A0AAE1HWK9_9NEOP|nr:Voltage-dependent P/Q-type calcium channel subunit alpha-1A [Frankliniella fusca]